MILVLLFASQLNSVQASKTHRLITSNIVIDAPPKAVFESIRQARNSQVTHRKLESYDGQTAVITEDMQNVPVYGKVHCIWQEVEEPYSKISFRLLHSDKFKEGYGTWTLKPLAEGKSTELELSSYTDSGLSIPFAAEITKMESSKSAKVRLEHIKHEAELIAKQNKSS
jgi:uncharacterized protein YndB with AHSA1/START domain